MTAEEALPEDEVRAASRSRLLATVGSGQNVGRVRSDVGGGSDPSGCIPAKIDKFNQCRGWSYLL